MSLNILSLFPNYIHRVRTLRGSPPKLKISQYPSNEEFFKALGNCLLFEEYVDERDNKDKYYYLSLYSLDDRVGLLTDVWCLCRSCSHPILGCESGANLQYSVNHYFNLIRWHNSFAHLYNLAPNVVKTNKFIASLNKYATDNKIILDLPENSPLPPRPSWPRKRSPAVTEATGSQIINPWRQLYESQINFYTTTNNNNRTYDLAEDITIAARPIAYPFPASAPGEIYNGIDISDNITDDDDNV